MAFIEGFQSTWAEKRTEANKTQRFVDQVIASLVDEIADLKVTGKLKEIGPIWTDEETPEGCLVFAADGKVMVELIQDRLTKKLFVFGRIKDASGEYERVRLETLDLDTLSDVAEVLHSVGAMLADCMAVTAANEGGA